eukprot:3903210-Amphidinium_carterae.1
MDIPRPVLGVSSVLSESLVVLQGASNRKSAHKCADQPASVRPEGGSARNPSGLTWRGESSCGTLERERRAPVPDKLLIKLAMQK